jgi:Ni/Co efflux regulator RcnB
MKAPLVLSLTLLLGTAAAAVAAQDTWRGEQRIARGEDRGGGRAAPDYGSRTQGDHGAHWNNQRGNTYWDREQRQARGGGNYPNEVVDNPRQYRDQGRHPAEGNGFNPGYRGYDRPDYRAQHRDDRRWDDRQRWSHRERWEERGLPSHRRDWDRDRYQTRHWRDDDWKHNWRHQQWRSHWYHGWSGSRYRAPVRYSYPHGYGYYRWSIGYRLPAPFLIASYYVDYDHYGLAPPPYGCRWLRVDRDLLLVELVSGEIVDVLYNFYF